MKTLGSIFLYGIKFEKLQECQSDDTLHIWKKNIFRVHRHLLQYVILLALLPRINENFSIFLFFQLPIDSSLYLVRLFPHFYQWKFSSHFCLFLEHNLCNELFIILRFFSFWFYFFFVRCKFCVKKTYFLFHELSFFFIQCIHPQKNIKRAE